LHRIREEGKEEEDDDEDASVDEEPDKKRLRRGHDFAAGFGRNKTAALGLENTVWDLGHRRRS
jgi:hypothetical protein